MAERRTIPAGTTEAHTIVLHSAIDDVREVLEMCSMAWFVIAFLIGIDALTSALDQSWLWAAFSTALTGFAVWSALDFRRRSRKYKTGRRKPAADPSARADQRAEQ